MKTTYTELLKYTSNTKIAFLKDVKTSIRIDKRGKFKYFYTSSFDKQGIANFISTLDMHNFYTLIPIISKYGRDEDPQIILSKQILITHYSDPKRISDFINSQLEIALSDFEISSLNNNHYLIFKYKRIVLEI